MHALFMKGATVKSLLAEYGIETTQKQLQPLLPLRILNDQPCPGCGAPLQQKWATKTYGLPPAFCKSCGHQQLSVCTCRYCLRKRLKRANREWSDKRVTFSQLCLKHKILLMALLLTQQDDIAGVHEINSIGPFAPDFSSTEGFIGELWSAGAIVLTRAPEWVTSNYRSEWMYVPEAYGWSSNVSANTAQEKALTAWEVIERLRRDFDTNLQLSDEPELITLIRELAEHAGFAYLEQQMGKEKLDISAAAATRKVLRCMIETLPLADICAIGWQASKNCGRAYTNKVATSRKHAANMLPGQMARVAESRALKPDTWKVDRAFNRVSRIERVLHDELFGGQDTFFNWPLDRYCEEVVLPRLQSGRKVTPSRAPSQTCPPDTVLKV